MVISDIISINATQFYTHFTFEISYFDPPCPLRLEQLLQEQIKVTYLGSVLTYRQVAFTKLENGHHLFWLHVSRRPVPPVRNVNGPTRSAGFSPADPARLPELNTKIQFQISIHL